MEPEGLCRGEMENEISRQRKEVAIVRLGLAVSEREETKAVSEQNAGI